ITTDEHLALAAMGMTRWQLMSLSLTRVGGVGVLGALVAVGVATALSPLTPVGLARVVEPSLGLHLNLRVLGFGAVAIVAVVLVMGAWPAWRTAGIRADTAADARASRSRLADALARAGSPVSVAAGARMALEPGVGRTAVPVR